MEYTKWELNKFKDCVHDGHVVVAEKPHGITFEKWEPAARLISAAPELLEACKYAAQWYSDNLSIMPVAFQTVANELEAAIAKGEG